jgi:nucleotide-binding universal stress UspA family protein
VAQLFRKILCPIGFDDNSLLALDLACKIAAENEATLCLIHVIPASATIESTGAPVAPVGSPPLSPDAIQALERDAANKLQEIGRQRLGSKVPLQILTTSGPPAQAIVQAESELNSDLVVMATHGRARSALGHFFMGSVAERVVRESTCPVLVVPPK